MAPTKHKIATWGSYQKNSTSHMFDYSTTDFPSKRTTFKMKTEAPFYLKWVVLSLGSTFCRTIIKNLCIKHRWRGGCYKFDIPSSILPLWTSSVNTLPFLATRVSRCCNPLLSSSFSWANMFTDLRCLASILPSIFFRVSITTLRLSSSTTSGINELVM